MIIPRTSFIKFISWIVFSLPSSMIAQAPMVGIDFGLGRSQMTTHGHSFISPFDQDFYTRKHIGLHYYKPVSSWLSLTSGLEFINRKGTDDRFSYFALPLNVDITLGKVFQFLIGPGMNVTYLFSYDLGHYKNHPGFDESKNKVQINWQVRAGIGIKISARTRIHFLCEQGFDLTPIYDQSDRHPVFVQGERWYDGMITVGVMTILPGKKSI